MPRPLKPAPDTTKPRVSDTAKPRVSDTTPKPRPSRGKSGKPSPPPAERAGGTPETKRSAAAGFAEAPQAPFLPAAPSTLPALRQVGPPTRNFTEVHPPRQPRHPLRRRNRQELTGSLFEDRREMALS